ncbi:MAG: Maf-like protein, partial [Proteobacteria bacterium]
VLQMVEPDQKCVIIAADTTVVSPRGTILNKPESESDAARMLGQLQGQTHTVYTAYTILAEADSGKQKSLTRVIATRVTMRPLKKAEILAYIQTGEPMDKAGAYGAQSIGMGLIAKIQGSYTNVVGLPVAELMNDLETKFAVTGSVTAKWNR